MTATSTWFIGRLTSVTGRTLIPVALAAGLLGAPHAAAAQGTPVKLVTLDLAVPDSPAFAILGLSPETVVRPASPRDLATTVLNGVDKRGNLQSGLAVDLAPLFLFSGNTLTYNDYRGSRATQVYGRTQVSFATAKGTGDADKSLRLATGVRVTLWDDGDPRLDDTLLKCLDDIAVPVPTRALLTQADRDAFVAKATADRRPAVEGCHKAFKAQRWNASSLAVGVAPSWQSKTGETADFSYAGAAVWASLAVGLSSTTASNGGSPTVRAFGQLIVQGRYRNRELVPDKNVKGIFFEQDSSGLGARLLLGTADRAAVVETEVSRQSPATGDSTTSFKLSGGGQLKVSNDVWVSFTAGGIRGGAANEQRGGFVLSSLKWALSREPAIKLP
jgi:hypothetical protein